MTQLVSADAYIERFNAIDTTDMRAAIQVAIEEATVQLEAVLDTQFAQATQTDVFVLPQPPTPVHPETPLLRLTNGFVSGVVAKSAYDRSSFGDAEAIGSAWQSLASEKGFLTIDRAFELTYSFPWSNDTYYKQPMFQVAYTYGFTASDVGGGEMVYNSVPTILQNVALAWSQYAFEMRGGCKAKDAPCQPSLLPLARYSRDTSIGVRPL